MPCAETVGTAEGGAGSHLEIRNSGLSHQPIGGLPPAPSLTRSDIRGGWPPSACGISPLSAVYIVTLVSIESFGSSPGYGEWS